MTTATAPRKISKAKQNGIKASIRRRMYERKKVRPQIDTREEWLEAAVEIFRPWFTKVQDEVRAKMVEKGVGMEEASEFSCELPEALKVTCGWPSQRGTAARGRVIGECWSPKVSADKRTTQIFISPWMGDEIATRVLDVLLHECVHAGCGIKAGHGPIFKAVATSLGLTGPMTATIADISLWAKLDNLIISRIGYYPHKKMDVSEYERPVDMPKKQGTRMIKMICDDCGYIARTSSKWITEKGPVHCPDHGEMKVTR